MKAFAVAIAGLVLVPLPSPSQSAAGQSDARAVNRMVERMRHAEDLLERGDTKGAEDELKLLAADSPKDARVQFDLGFTEERNGEEDAAASAYRAAIAADPTLPEPLLSLGLLEARGGHSEAAHEHLAAVTKLAGAPPPLRARALRAMARLDESKKPDTAREELLQATQITGEQPDDAELSAGLAAGAGATPDAEAAYERILATTPGDPNATTGLAALLAHDGKLPQADALLGTALATHPEDVGLVAEAAAVYGAEGKNDEAITLLTGLRERDGKAASDPAITRLLAHLELVSGHPAAAEPLYRSLVSAEASDPRLLDDLGSALVRQNKFPEAETLFSKAVTMRAAFADDTAWGETAGHLAFAASRNHRPEVALRALSLRATVLPNSPASLFLQATSYDALRQYKQAQGSYRAFLAMANGKLPDEEFEARHRLIALEHEH